MTQYKYFLGQVFLNMALCVSNYLAVEDIEEAATAFKNLKLSIYPGKHIVNLTNEALRIMKTIDAGCSLHTRLDLRLLAK